jgi:hypothetical protein
MEERKARAGMAPLVLGVVIGWILGHAGIVGLILVGIGCVVVAYNRGYKIVITKKSETHNGERQC